MVTSQELKMVCRKSNEISGENCVVFEKKLFVFDKVWKKLYA